MTQEFVAENENNWNLWKLFYCVKLFSNKRGFIEKLFFGFIYSLLIKVIKPVNPLIYILPEISEFNATDFL